MDESDFKLTRDVGSDVNVRMAERAIMDESVTRAELLTEVARLKGEITRLEEAELKSKLAEAEHSQYYRHIEEMVEERTAEMRIANRQLQAEVEQRKRAEEALQMVAGQWRDTLDAINDAIWLMDLDQNIIRCNKAASKLLKKDYTNIIGRKCYELIHGGSNPADGCPFLRFHKTKRKETIRAASGDRWLNISVTPLKNKEGRVDGAVHVMSDVTTERRLREKIKELQKIVCGEPSDSEIL